MNSIFKLLSRPYPLVERENSIMITALLTGLFVALFLLVFLPFGTAEATVSNKYIKIGGFGMVTTVVLYFYFKYFSWLFSDWSKEKNWTVGKEIFLYVGLLICIGLGNGVYSIIVGLNPPRLLNVLGMLYSTFLVGVFPVTFFVILDYIYLLKKNIKEAADLQAEKVLKTQKSIDISAIETPKKEEKPIQLIAENGKDQIQVLAKDLFYLESSSNYVTIVYQSNDETQKKLLRSSLTRLENQISNENILRCHRSFIVNLEQVENISGNAQGYKLQMEGVEELVPVARKYAKVVVDYFHED